MSCYELYTYNIHGPALLKKKLYPLKNTFGITELLVFSKC